jgi:hypothetical protein
MLFPIDNVHERIFFEIVAGFLLGLEEEEGHTPNAETIAAFEEYEKNGGKSFSGIEELMADLNADD